MLIQNGSAQVSPTATTGLPGTSSPVSSMSAEERTAITTTLASTLETRQHISESSSIETVIIDRPAPSTYIDANLTGLIKKTSIDNVQKKFDEKKWELLPDDKDCPSTTNWNTLKQAFANNTAVNIHVGNMSTRAIGFMVKKGTANEQASAQPVLMNTKDLYQFLAVDAAAYIKSQDGKAGAQLRLTRAKVDKKNANSALKEKAVVSVVNTKQVFQKDSDGNYLPTGNGFDVSQEVDKEAGTKNKSLKSELAFKVRLLDQDQKKDGEYRVAVKRVSVEVPVPQLTRKAQYVDKFGIPGVTNKDLADTPSQDQMSKIMKAQTQAIHDLKDKLKSGEDVVALAPLQASLAAFDTNTAKADVEV